MDNAVKHSDEPAADVMHIEFTANANSQLQSLVGLFYNVAVQHKICITSRNHYIHYCICMIVFLMSVTSRVCKEQDDFSR